MSCKDRPPKKKKNGPCREVTVKEEVAVSSEVRLNITWYYVNFFWKLVSLKLQQTVLPNTVILYCLKSMRQCYWVLKAIVFAATDMPFFENCRTVASYIFAWTLLAGFSFQRHFWTGTKSSAPPKTKQFAWLACLHRTPTSNTKMSWVIKKLCELVSGNKRLTKNSAGNKFLLGR